MMANAVDYSITPQLRADLRQWRTRALIAGVVGTVVSAAGFFVAGPDAVLPLLPVVVHVHRRADPRSAGVAHAAIRHRRRLGPGDPPLLRGRHAHAAAGAR